jgi:hypothetical protein
MYVKEGIYCRKIKKIKKQKKGKLDFKNIKRNKSLSLKMCTVWSRGQLKAIHSFATPLPQMLHQMQLLYFIYFWLHVSAFILLHLSLYKQ